MMTSRIPTAQLLGILRWAIPVAISIVGVAYVLFKEVNDEGRPLFSVEILLTLTILSVVGPAFAWVTLANAAATARAEAQTRSELERSNRELTALNAINDVISPRLSPETNFELALGKMIELLDLDAGDVRFVQGETLVLSAHQGLPGDMIAAERTISLEDCLCGKCVAERKVMGGACPASSPLLVHSACERAGFASICSVPMQANGHVVGVIHVASRKPDAFPETRRQMLNAIGQRIAMTVENARLYDTLQRHAMHFETASLVGQRVTALMDLNALLSEVVRVIRDNFGYYHAHIFLVDEASNQVVLRAASGVSAERLHAQNLRLKIGMEGITGWVAHTGQTMVCRDVSREPRYWKSELLPETRSELAVPLRVGKRIIGVLDIQSNQLDSFEKEDVTVLQILGNQLGIAMENARLFAETKSRYEALMALHEISLEVISQLDRAKLLEDLVRRGVMLWDAFAGHIAFYAPLQDEIHIAANYHLPWDLSKRVFRPGEGVVGKVIQSGQGMILNDYRTWSERIEAYATGEIRAVMCSPLKWQEKVFGAITIVHNSSVRIFDENDLWLLTLFADLASIALKNAELHSQIMEFNQGLEHKVEERMVELSLAKEAIETQAVQLRSLLAKTIHLQEEERARIARDMHDGVMQLITAQRYELKAARVAFETRAAATGFEKLDSIRQVLAQMEVELRRAIYDLHPPALDAADLIPALQNYTRTFGEVFGIDCKVNISGAPYPLSDATQVAVFRIIEEALQNVAAHARATTSLIQLEYGPSQVGIEVRDNGRGFDFAAGSALGSVNHLGLVSMQERMRRLQGTMQVESGPGTGTCLKFIVPMRREDE